MNHQVIGQTTFNRKMTRVLGFVLLSFAALHCAKCELILSSFEDIKVLLRNEKQSINAVRDYVDKERRRLEELQRSFLYALTFQSVVIHCSRVKEYSNDNDVVLNAETNPVTNPFSAYKLVRRLFIQAQEIDALLDATDVASTLPFART